MIAMPLVLVHGRSHVASVVDLEDGCAVMQDLEKQDGKQARLQLEDMLTRIEMHFQAIHSSPHACDSYY